MPMTHADYLNPASQKFLPDLQPNGKQMYGPNDFMTWSFYGGTTDPGKMTPDTHRLLLRHGARTDHPDDGRPEDLDPKLVEALSKNRSGCLLGSDKLKASNKRVGDRFKLTSINYKGIDLEFEIVGVLPDGRYNASAHHAHGLFQRRFDQYQQRQQDGPSAGAQTPQPDLDARRRSRGVRSGSAASSRTRRSSTTSRQGRDRVVSGRLVSRSLPRHLLGHEVLARARHARRHGAGDGQRDQHQRARTP